MRISWIATSERIVYELRQREEEGNDVSELKAEWNAIEKLGLSNDHGIRKAEEFYRKLDKTPYVVMNSMNEPNEWIEIVDQCTMKSDERSIFTDAFISDRILGGWLGRSAGCLLGKPIEKTQREGIKELLSSNNTWPISDYITGKGIPDRLLRKYPWNKHSGRESLKENLECMTEDDDLNYPMLNLFTVEKYGEACTTENIIQSWMELMPVLSSFTAERVAYVNALNGILPPSTALEKNPYREWIGAQIRADLWGWISPGNPRAAAEFAWRDARVSHVRNGIYGEIFFAAAVAASFTHDSVEEIIIKTLDYIPPKSRFAEAIRFVLNLSIHDRSWEEIVDTLYQEFGMYHWVHTINNAALAVAAVLYSKGDFEKAICNVVMGGWDTDSNGATVGSLIGTMIGAQKLPSKWIIPLHNTIRSSLKGFDQSLLSDLAGRTAHVAKYHHNN